MPLDPALDEGADRQGLARAVRPKLIEGEVDFLCYRSMFPWDHLAGGLMATELGGRMATDAGVDYQAGVIGRQVGAEFVFKF